MTPEILEMQNLKLESSGLNYPILDAGIIVKELKQGKVSRIENVTNQTKTLEGIYGMILTQKELDNTESDVRMMPTLLIEDSDTAFSKAVFYLNGNEISPANQDEMVFNDVFSSAVYNSGAALPLFPEINDTSAYYKFLESSRETLLPPRPISDREKCINRLTYCNLPIIGLSTVTNLIPREPFSLSADPIRGDVILDITRRGDGDESVRFVGVKVAARNLNIVRKQGRVAWSFTI